MTPGTAFRVLLVTRTTSDAATAILATGSTNYEGQLVEHLVPACAGSHVVADGDILRLHVEGPHGELVFKQVSCACTAALHAVWSWPTGQCA